MQFFFLKYWDVFGSLNAKIIDDNRTVPTSNNNNNKQKILLFRSPNYVRRFNVLHYDKGINEVEGSVYLN